MQSIVSQSANPPSPIRCNQVLPQLSFSTITVSYVEAPGSYSSIPVHTVDALESPRSRMQVIDPKQQLSFLGELFSQIAEAEGVHVPTDYLPLSLTAMKQLACSGRSNVLYGVSRGLGFQRVYGSDSVFPAKKS